jgi:hypothetical protein
MLPPLLIIARHLLLWSGHGKRLESRLGPEERGGLLFAHFTLLWAANLMLAIVMRHAWIASGQWGEHQLQFSVLIGFPGAALTIIWLAWVVYSFGGNERQEKTTQTS